ncbi:ABC transporter permease [Clostridium estertheticum]|uniref:Spermidine/putrescine ABC transporter permease n=1 Tax=Clostridium estertheticum subsp. estertheticum TaxID=1552 RepID=A0A1J0GGG3_9CLOT|nr:ABC transporter permease [Clostridium estertheticum]APC40458.1 spermidine/putrescine ABC transporter permease [Clostridium estertheticum subsp. estertheticum]MBU3173071.1 ABC transporter permease [Clostridium estertheticum]MBZ9617719.1 ABC transporter permease [Clostridium estertheticum subsp. laramiense]WAG73393.1 ABC transporter permease [Clostridium estertheticum]
MKNKKSRNSIKKYLSLHLKYLTTISPALIWLIVFFVMPLLFIVIVSFSTRGEVGNIIYKFTLGNYIRLLDPLYINIFIKSVLIATYTTMLCLIFGYPFAYIIANFNKKFKPLLLLLIILPFWTNSLVRTYAIIVLLKTEGIINTLLLHFHIINIPLNLMYNNFAVMIGMLYMMFPFMVLPLYTSIEKLDKRILDAASDLGAGPFYKFIKIILPLTKGGIVSGSILVFIPTLGLFFVTDLMGGSKVILMSNLIKNQFLTARDWPFGSAISVILIIVMLTVILYSTKLTGTKGTKEVL